MKVLCGELHNHLARALSITVTSESTLFPKAHLYSQWPAEEFRFNAAAADVAITTDLALWQGNLDTWASGVPTGFSNQSDGTGTVVETSVAGEVVTGSAAKVSGGATPAQGILRKTITVRAGERIRYRPSIRGDGTANGIALVRVFNPDTGNFWNNTVWGSATAEVFSRQTATHAEQDTTIPVESYRTVGDKPTTTLYIDHVCAGTGFAYFDNLYAWPETNWLSIHGHNLPGIVAVQWRSSSDNFGASDVLDATMTKRQPSFYHFLSSAITLRYIRARFLGGFATVDPIAIGELVLGYATTPAAYASYAIRLREREAQVAGDKTVVSMRRRAAQRVVEWPIVLSTSAEWQEYVEEIRGRCRGQLHPLVVAPDDVSDTDLVVYGRLAPEWEASRALLSRRESSMIVIEHPFATRVA